MKTILSHEPRLAGPSVDPNQVRKSGEKNQSHRSTEYNLTSLSLSLLPVSRLPLPLWNLTSISPEPNYPRIPHNPLEAMVTVPPQQQSTPCFLGHPGRSPQTDNLAFLPPPLLLKPAYAEHTANRVARPSRPIRGFLIVSFFVPAARGTRAREERERGGGGW